MCIVVMREKKNPKNIGILHTTFSYTTDGGKKICAFQLNLDVQYGIMRQDMQGLTDYLCNLSRFL